MSTPRGIRNNNPGNIEINSRNDWKGKIVPSRDHRFETFETMEYGIRALLIILRNYIRKGHNSVELIIKRWAPSSENNTEAYIKAVCAYMGVIRNEELFFILEDMLPLTKAICKHENGGEYITNEQIERAWEEIR
jgi:hypothetical protein